VHHPRVTRELPSGTVTFMFTDVEGSTKLLHALGAEAYANALAAHRRILRDAFSAHGGIEVDTQGDAFFVAFPTAPGALSAAAQAREALADGPIQVRIGLHTGTPHLTDEGYVGADVHRAARIAAAGHGGQILVSAATAALLDADGLRDLGDHRLKDLTVPERIYQLGGEEHPPLKTLHQTNLPIPATPFLGREAEVAEIAELLTRDNVRLVTLTGPGGTGKTRLALQAAGSVADSYPGGVWWVPLALLRDPDLVLESAAKALGASGDLAEHIGDTRLLLVLDNFEHLMAAAADVAPLLSRCRNLSLLATSREPMHLAGEHEYAVDPLQRAEATELFMTRALAANREVVATAEVAAICERLDDLPLAIELAAARVKLLSPAALLERLGQRLPLLSGGGRDAPDRQRTLRATIEWSHELLTSDEQRLFARLAAFRGGCTVRAAEAVADADLDTLGSLVDKSLVRVRGDRFWMLETIREFALERLEASSEGEDLRRRHAQFFLALAEEAEPHLGGDPTVGLRLLDPEHDNLRAALDRLEAAGDHEPLLRLTTALSDFWGLRGRFIEGQRRFGAALAAHRRRTALRAAALVAAGRHAVDTDEELRFAEEALSIYRELDDAWGIAHARYAVANALTAHGRWAEARDLMEESVRAFEELGEDFQLVSARRGLAWTHEELGDIARYRELTEENLVQARALGIRRIEARSAGALAMLALAEGRLGDTRPLLDTSYDIDQELGNAVFVTVDLVRFAALCAAEGRHDVAIRLLALAKTLRDEISWRPESWAQKEYDDTLQAARGSRPDEAFARAWEEGVALSVDDAVALARGR
jgi:predicted ATPase/class 3 adenylate cyclase